jgi:hypothetical protein
MVKLYLHSPIFRHGTVINKLSAWFFSPHGVRLSPLGTAATIPRMMMIVEQSVEYELEGENEVLGMT